MGLKGYLEEIFDVMELAPTRAVKDLVEVRAVASTQGHDADISIHSIALNNSRGLDDKALLTVARPRTEWVAICVTSEGAEKYKRIKSRGKSSIALSNGQLCWPQAERSTESRQVTTS